MCPYCGQPATGRDHVPPRCIFPRDRENLIGAPACDAHNERRSWLNALLLEVLGFFAAHATPFDNRLWDRAWKRLKHCGRDRVLRERMIHDRRNGVTAVGVEAATVHRLGQVNRTQLILNTITAPALDWTPGFPRRCCDPTRSFRCVTSWPPVRRKRPVCLCVRDRRGRSQDLCLVHAGPSQRSCRGLHRSGGR